ncbi:PAN domain-containing protein [Oryzicola mucosus]|uniref:Apple domain-containing protein n=1 Tax=Oryzicola mucosus TaxID=2767425 RepID=A0A8J6PPF9_9HYPH|nr:PAN domain-containing protein [Oryzicola mucosus]MBD0415380.1 hypothetical protein [Oryzicola mucosus]
MAVVFHQPSHAESYSIKNGQADKRYADLRNADLTGSALQSSRAPDQPACERMCSKTTGCVAYTFDAWNSMCHLKSTYGEKRLNARARSGVQMGMGLPGSSANPVYFEYFNDKAFPEGIGRKLRATARIQCEQACTGEAACIAFNFSKTASSCELFGETEAYTKKKGIEAGAKTQ